MNRKLMDDYEEALIALLMDSYSEEEGKRLIEQAKELEANGGYTFSDGFENRIHAACRIAEKKKRKKRFIRATKRTATHAAVFVVLIGFISSFLFVTVQAFRAKVYDFFIYQQAQGVTVTMEKDDFEEFSKREDMLDDVIMTPQWCPDGFSPNVLYNNSENVQVFYVNKNDPEQYIDFFSYSPSVNITLDNENAQRFELIDLLNHSGLIIEKEGVTTIYWQDKDRIQQFSIISNCCSVDDLLKMAESMYN